MEKIAAAFFIAGLASGPAHAGLTVPKSLDGFATVTRQTIPEKKLRGYGTVSGRFSELALADSNRVSVLLIACDDEAHAATTLGKFLSDARCLGGVADETVSVNGKDLPVLRVEGQGFVAAARIGSRVAMIAGKRADDVRAAMAAMRIGDADFRGSAVPMWLDRYDKYGWHFYFSPWSAPHDDKNYDLDSNFQYLAKQRVGMMIPLSLNNIDPAEGVIDYANLSWAIERGRELEIPTFIQSWGIGAPRSLINRYPFDTQLYAPQFVGNLYGPGENGGGYPPEVSWSSQKAEDMLLDWLQPIYKRYAGYPNVTGYAEPHGEIEHGTPMVFTEYGPVANETFRKFLREKYRTTKAVDQRWAGGRGAIKSWDDVRVPEVAEFLGWGTNAVDVGGAWRFAYGKDLPADQIASWTAASLDDGSWKTMIAPGDDHPRFRNQQTEMRVPAVFRRAFNLSAAQRDELTRGKCYLYIWSLNRAGKPVEAAINGKKVGSFASPGNVPAWCAFEVSDALRDGDNLLALRLPWSELAYRIYLSPVAPRSYPDLGAEMNARWVDFSDFVVWTRYDQTRKGMETIRREDPDKFIKLMSPNGMIDFNKIVAEDYGGTFHNTGYMSGWWNEYLPALMRSSGLPFTLEPGNGAPDLPTLKRFVGHWMTEGVNGVDYFQNLGEIIWDPAQKAWFESNAPLVHLVGKYHNPPAQVAVMYGGRSDRLGGFPWSGFADQGFGLNGNSWARLQLEGRIPAPHDIILESDFPRGNADKYRVVIDGSTSIMDDVLVSRIEKWVRDGGVFVAYGQTGRHAPETKDAWPFAKLSGYRVVSPGRGGQLIASHDQKVFASDAWAAPVNANGMSLQAMATNCKTLLAWQDGRPAVGMRKVGKGFVITMPVEVRGMLNDVLRWSGQFTEAPTAPGCFPVRYLSNNGFHQIYALWGDKISGPTNTTLTIPGADAPRVLRDVVSGATLVGVVSTNGVTFAHIAMDKDEIHAYIAPLDAITAAPRGWFNLQRDWWQGTVAPRPAPEIPAIRNTIALDEGWAFSPATDSTNALSLIAPGVDDKTWKRIDLGIWNVQGFRDVTHGVFRRQVTIPSRWKDGRIWCWLAGSGDTIRPPYRVKFYIDGVLAWSSRGGKYDIMTEDFTDRLAPGKHLLAWDMEGTGKFDGVVGDSWIEFVPTPVFTQSLAGDWGNGVMLPGRGPLAGTKRTFTPDPRGKDYLVQFCIEGASAEVQSVFINGRNVFFYGGPRGHHRRMTLNPWLKWGGPNEIEIKPCYNDAMDISTVELRFYRPDQF